MPRPQTRETRIVTLAHPRPALAIALAIALLTGPALGQDSGQTDAELPPLAERGYALGDIILGDPDAPVTLFEYYSPTCSHCGNFHRDTFPQVKSEYIDTGQIRFVAREVYFDQVGVLAGRIARCAGPDSYYPLIDLVLNTQESWSRDSEPANALVDTVLRAGFPTSRLRDCLADREYGIHLVDESLAITEAEGIRSTPTFIIEGRTVNGAVPFAEIAEAIEAALP